MIKIIESGTYKLIETAKQTKILIINGRRTFAWVNADAIGEILVTSHKKHKTDHVLSLGNYRLYEVKNEPKLTDLLHLELHAGNGVWQAYLLPLGLPNGGKARSRIIPTKEEITKVYKGSFS